MPLKTNPDILAVKWITIYTAHTAINYMERHYAMGVGVAVIAVHTLYQLS
jgi:hypothetical protein